MIWIMHRHDQDAGHQTADPPPPLVTLWSPGFISSVTAECRSPDSGLKRESRPSLNIITLVIIFTILYFNFFVKLACDELRQNVTKQSRKELNSRCFGKIKCFKYFDPLKRMNRTFGAYNKHWR